MRALDHIEREGEAFLAQVDALGLEGIIAKRADAPYRGGPHATTGSRSRPRRRDDFVIVGFTAPKGTRGNLGALQLADMVERRARLRRPRRHRVQRRAARRARSDARSDDRARRRRAARRSARTEPPPQIPETKTTTWVEPRYVCEVRFASGRPTACCGTPTFLRMRDDKDPRDCERQGCESRAADQPERRRGQPRDAAAASCRRLPPPSRRSRRPSTSRTSRRSTGRRSGYTKGDLIDYYRAISPWMLPYLRNRPLVMTRFPDGIDGKSFYQKDAPEFAPAWMRTMPIWSEDTQRDIDYFVCDDVESLLYVANLGSIPLHIWASRVGSLEQPDWCVIDLDPKEAPFSDVIQCGDRLPRAVRGDRPAELREDDRQDRPAHPAAARPPGARTRSPARSASCSRASRCASSATSRRSRGTSRSAATRCTSTICRIVMAS